MTEEKASSASQTEIGFFEIVDLLVSSWKIIFSVSVVFSAIGVVYALLATPIFKATTTILPPQQQQSAANAMISALGGGVIGSGGGGGGGIGAALGLKNPSDIYVAFFKSRRIGDSIVKKFNLIDYYGLQIKTDALKALAKATHITAAKEGLLIIQVEDKDPEISAKIANAYVEELRSMTKNFAVSEASQRRKYFEEQLKMIKDSLAHAEGQLRIFQEKSGIIEPEVQSRSSAEAMAELRSQIVAKEIEIRVMAESVTENNPKLIQYQKALGGLRSHLKALTKGDGDDVWIAKGKTPELGLEYARKYRDVRYFESLFEFTAKQYEMARMDEAKDGMLIQVVDYAQVPEVRERPKRSLIVILSAFFGALSSSIFVVGRMILNPSDQTRVRTRQ
ncbi:MAG TPA: Wzz/FepE/Etk N-terminal domain-containing protein [Fibrobacteria bacterium]|nr:Wzz/FepE/Etk N-terminal domain-containing protein [Fibrobacteria bacterium]